MSIELDKDQQAELRYIGAEGEIRRDRIDRIIGVNDSAPPKRSFDIEVSSQTREVNKVYLGAALSGLAGDVLIFFMRRELSGDNGGLPEFVIGVISIVLLVLAVFGGKGLVHVTGEELRINGRGYFASDIDMISCKGMDVKVHSGGKTVLRLKKADTGCEELIKWAKAYDIAIKNTDGEPSRSIKVLMAVGAVLFVAAFTVLLFFIVTKM
ncbi:hypothetical protein [Ruminococcus sp.]|uniref:hypothetical protein n=1 Tax=Ruminococcus sp. TaxID=41978 RepID=UPI0025F0BB2D|nr:hypothetical protein [Ruminococcus sp.]MCR4638683.1 hypothetical protein [Ruminococcus sp.]